MKELTRAEQLEDLLPRLFRALYRPDQADPLSDLTLAQIRVVQVLFAGDLTMSALGEDLAMSPSAATQMINRLQTIGMVEKREDPLDKRVKVLTLTPLGFGLMEERRNRRIDRVDQVLRNIDEERQISLIEALNEFMEECRSVASPRGYKTIMIGELALPTSARKMGGLK